GLTARGLSWPPRASGPRWPLLGGGEPLVEAGGSAQEVVALGQAGGGACGLGVGALSSGIASSWRVGSSWPCAHRGGADRAFSTSDLGHGRSAAGAAGRPVTAGSGRAPPPPQEVLVEPLDD